MAVVEVVAVVVVAGVVKVVVVAIVVAVVAVTLVVMCSVAVYGLRFSLPGRLLYAGREREKSFTRGCSRSSVITYLLI